MSPGRYRLRRYQELDAEQQLLYNRIVSGPRHSQKGQAPLTDETGALLGPFGLMTIAPAVGDPIQQVGAALRFSTGLSPLVREAAVLLVAAHHRSDFEWSSHAGLARAAGLGEAALTALGGGEVPGSLDSEDAYALQTVQTLLISGSLGDDHYHDAVARLGERTVAELVWLCGYYSMLALALAVFDPPRPLESEAPPWPRTGGEDL